MPFVTGKQRYKVVYGGRGSSKSWAAARALIARCLSEKTRVLCAREIQKSIAESVHTLLKQQIEMCGVSDQFDILETVIRTKSNGSEIVFTGLRRNVGSLKSFEGVNICWIEEAETVSADSWETLNPTIRKDDSEIWITFNPRFATDATWKKFVQDPPTDA